MCEYVCACISDIGVRACMRVCMYGAKQLTNLCGYTISNFPWTGDENFGLGVWCDVNTTVSTLSLSRRHSACRDLSLSLSRSFSLPSARYLRPSRDRHASLPRSLVFELPTLFRVGHVARPAVQKDTRSIARTYTHTGGQSPAADTSERGNSHAHACVRACVRPAPVRSRPLAFSDPDRRLRESLPCALVQYQLNNVNNNDNIDG